MIMLGRDNSQKYFGKDPDIIVQPYTRHQVDWLMQNSEVWPIACASFAGQIDNHYPPDKLVQFCNHHEFFFLLVLHMNLSRKYC